MTIAPSQKQADMTGFVGQVLQAVGDAVMDVEQCTDRRGIARIDPARTVEIACTMLAMDGARLATATGVDVRDGVDILYHWAIEPQGVVVTLKALAARPDVAIDSIANDVPAGNWIEREMHDLLGVEFRGHPDMRRLVLDDSWPEDVHPLLKSFDQIEDRPPPPPNQSPPEIPPQQAAPRRTDS